MTEFELFKKDFREKFGSNDVVAQLFVPGYRIDLVGRVRFTHECCLIDNGESCIIFQYDRICELHVFKNSIDVELSQIYLNLSGSDILLECEVGLMICV